MRSLLDALQTPTPVTFRRLPRGFHSVAKQTSFETPFIRAPIEFRRDFGRFWAVCMEVKIYFLEVFRDAFAERVVESVL